jgi:hypothetical protein
VLYSDEIVPGNTLSHDNKRKIQVIYWSFLQFGPAALASEEFWITLTAIRSSLVSDMAGGMSYVFRRLLPSFFDASSHDFRAGIAVQVGLDVRLVFGILDMIVSDESALRQTWLCKGASGTRPCMLCKNIVDKDSELTQCDDSGYLVPSSCCEFGKLDLHTDASIRDVINKLAANVTVLNKSQFAKLEQELGFNFCSAGLLCDEGLRTIVRPITTTTYDWAHVYLVNGLFALEFGLLNAKLKPHGVTYSDFHQYLQLWSWPVRISSRQGLLFNQESRRISESRCVQTHRIRSSFDLSHIVHVRCGSFIADRCREGGLRLFCLTMRCIGYVDNGAKRSDSCSCAAGCNRTAFSIVQKSVRRGAHDTEAPPCIALGRHARQTHNFGELLDT